MYKIFTFSDCPGYCDTVWLLVRKTVPEIAEFYFENMLLAFCVRGIIIGSQVVIVD